MDSGPRTVVDITSDDEEDHDWISELLEEIEKRKDDGVPQNPTTEGLELDDDCVVLDGDPEKVDVVRSSEAAESDDLIVVGEKGQNACRDYPHSRHLCANFPFTSSPHDRHCNQCHCYVCDLVAPCVHWGNGTSPIDHCHANDKDKFWISQRQYAKQVDKAPQPVHKFSDTSPSALPQQNQCPTQTWLLPDSAALNQIFRRNAIQACTTQQNPCQGLTGLTPDSAAVNQIFRPTSASFGISNITSQGRNQQFAHVLSRNKFQPHLVSQHLQSARNDFIQGNPRHNSGNSGPHVINSRQVFKRAGSQVALATNPSGYGSFYNDLITQCCRNASGAAASNDQNPSGLEAFPYRVTSNQSAYHLPIPQNISSVFVNSVPSQTQVHSQPFPAVNDSNDQNPSGRESFPYRVTPNQSAYHLPTHQNISSVFVNSVPSQTQVYSQPIPAVNDMQTVFQRVNEDFSAPDQQFSEADTSQPIPVVNDMQAVFQRVNEDFSAPDQQFSEVDTSLIPRQSNEQYLPDNSQVLSAEFDPQSPLKKDTGLLDFLVDSWMLNYQSALGSQVVSEPSGLNIYPPEPVPVDTGFFLDF